MESFHPTPHRSTPSSVVPPCRLTPPHASSLHTRDATATCCVVFYGAIVESYFPVPAHPAQCNRRLPCTSSCSRLLVPHPLIPDPRSSVSSRHVPPRLARRVASCQLSIATFKKSHMIDELTGAVGITHGTEFTSSDVRETGHTATDGLEDE